ncbi:MAG: polyprenyl synthetase family protein [Sporolactobacillus sp.]
MSDEQTVQLDVVRETMLRQAAELFERGHFSGMAERYVSYHAGSGWRFAEMTRLHYQLFGNKGDGPLDDTAAAVEWIALCADLLDDRQDHDREAAPWSIDPADEVLLFEHAVLLMALATLQRVIPQAYALISRLLTQALAGQYADHENVWTTEDTYMRQILLKSGSLTALACVSGLAAAGQAVFTEHPAFYMSAIGVYAQLRNDLRDVATLAGKSDILSRKKTPATMYLIEHPDKEGKRLAGYFAGKLTLDEMLEQHDELAAWVRERSGVTMYMRALGAVWRQRAAQDIDRIRQINDDDKRQLMLLFKV